MKSKVLVVDDYDEIRELVGFILETNMDVEVLQNSCGNDAIKTLLMYPEIKMVITDLNMPNGNGEDILNFMKKNGRTAPILFLTGDDLAAHPKLSGYSKLARIPKPFTDEQVLNTVKGLLTVSDPSQPTYVPVRIELLHKVQDIKTPLFVKINENKYVKLTQENSNFDSGTFEKYQNKDVKHLFIEATRIQDFISEYRKKTLSDIAWKQAAAPGSDAEFVRLNTELLRSLVNQVGWSDDLIDIAQDHFQRALKIAAANPNLTHVIHQFQKIERFGYADHCTLILLLTTKMAFELGFSEESTLQKLTFASLFHDMTLTDDQYQHKDKYLKQIISRDAAPTQDLKNVLAHPNRAAELCRHWDFCPSIVDTIIFQHHERPDGSGFPMGRRANELHQLSCLFLFCEDFVEFYIRHFGEIDVAKFLKSRQTIYSTGFFIDLVNTFKKIMTPASEKQKAS